MGQIQFWLTQPGVVAAARELTELVFYGLRDHRIHCLATQQRREPSENPRWARIVLVMIPEPARRDRPI